jgi:radical SAM protein with 4Fe4S-binding SPASM domain
MRYLKYSNEKQRPIFVDWAITNKCYLNCTHCRYRGMEKSATETQRHKELNLNEAFELATEINAINPNWVLIEGGEPFLREDLFSVLEILKFDTRPIYIITSGIGFNELHAQKCQELNIKLMISVDSAIKKIYEKIRKGAHFNDVIKAIKIANKYNILDSINYTLQELNTSSKEIEAIGKLAKRYKIKSINFLGYKPNTCTVSKTAIPDFSKVFTDIINIQQKYGLKVMVDEPFFNPWIKNSKFQIPNSKFNNKGPIIVEDKSGCIFGEYIFIEPDGTTKPCSFSPVSFEKIGNNTIKKIQDKRNRKGKCGKCEYLLQCGGCRVRTYTLTGDWFESDPFCPL